MVLGTNPVLRYGPRAAIVECPPEQVLGLSIAFRETGQFLEVVPAERSVLVSWAEGVTFEDVQGLVRAAAEHVTTFEPRDIEIPVRYDGLDLEVVSEALALDVDEIIALHTGATYTAAFAGFAPGFMYCVGLPEQLVLPRRPTPRASVPAGSVAIADIYTAVYPMASPGGWHLLGTTDATLLDLQAAEPSLIRPGDRVHFVSRSA